MEAPHPTPSAPAPPAPGPQRPILRWGLPLAAAGLALAGLASASASATEAPPGPEGWLLAPALGLVLLVLGRRMPVLACAISGALVLGYYASGRAPIGLELLLAPALLGAAERGRTRAAAAVAGAVIVFAFAARLLVVGQDPLRILGVQLPTAIVIAGGAIACGAAIRLAAARGEELERRRRLELAAREAELREQFERTRRAVARDVHDVLAHTLIIAGQQTSIAAATLERSPETAREALEAARTALRGSSRETRGLVDLLRGDAPQDLAPAPRLAELEAALAALAAGRELRFESRLASPPAAAAEAALCRIAGEAVANAVRHSEASRIDVAIEGDEDRIRLRVADDGGAAAIEPGRGIRGMAERAELLGGRLEVRAGGDGVEVLAEIPTAGAS